MRAHAVIAVSPPSAAAMRSRLFRALEHAFPVRFEPCESLRVAADRDGCLAFGPLDEAALSPGLPTMIVGGAPLTGAPSDITFTKSSCIDHRLRGRMLAEPTKYPLQLSPLFDAEILATRGAAPVWARQSDAAGRSRYLAAAFPEELQAGEQLKERLRARQFQALLPLVHFLRAVTARWAWNPPPLRAMFIFDDPNLRWPSYGHINYPDLLEHARHFGYHAAMAMSPIDSAFVHPSAARLYREHPDQLSLLMHGLEHSHLEFMQALPPAARERRVVRAFRRIEAFERRSRVMVSRVMCAPHGHSSEQYLATLLRFGVEALFAHSPFPWPGGVEERPTALTGWHPVNFVAGGMPVIPRYRFTLDPDEIVLRAFLDYPLILWGHHQLLADGLDPLERATTLVNSLGPAKWTSAPEIARQNFVTRREGATLFVRLLARRVDVTTPAQVKTIELDLSLVDGDLDHHEVVVTSRSGEAAAMPAARTVAIEVPTGRLGIEVRPRRQLDHHGLPAARLRPWPILRRALTETRDRLRPLLR